MKALPSNLHYFFSCYVGSADQYIKFCVQMLVRSSGGMTLCLHDRLCVCVSAFWYTLFYILVYTFLSVYIFLIQQLIRFIFGMHVP